jgi:peptidoglycan/LPS O-acetylase OafA/YrhL
VFFFYPALAPAENQQFMALSLPIVWLIGILWIWLVMGISMLTYRSVELPMRRLINARFTTPKPIPAVI